jgi:hypothetical protein
MAMVLYMAEKLQLCCSTMVFCSGLSAADVKTTPLWAIRFQRVLVLGAYDVHILLH